VKGEAIAAFNEAIEIQNKQVIEGAPSWHPRRRRRPPPQ
jgi:hypothetical protein